MTLPTCWRRTLLHGAVAVVASLAVVAADGGQVPVAAVEPTDSANRLDQPMADVAILEDGESPRLLVLDAFDALPGVATLRILERSAAWESMAESPVDLGGPGLDRRWIVGLGPDRFVLVATSATDARALLVGLRITGIEGRAVEETARSFIDAEVVDTGVADIDGDGNSELVVGWMDPVAGACVDSHLSAFDAGTLRSIGEIVVAGRALGAGVIGRFDDQPGDELLAYAEDRCTPLDDLQQAPLDVMVIRLIDGRTVFETPSSPRFDGPWIGPPIRLDLDGRAPDEALAVLAEGLVILDPGAAWTATQLDATTSIPLVAGPVADAAGPGARIAWLHVVGPGSGTIVTQHLRRARDGSVESASASTLEKRRIDVDRWTLIVGAAVDAAMRQAPAAGWLGDTVDAGCPVLVVHAALLPCGEADLRAAAAWVGTRPITALDEGGRRRFLVAAGLAWDPEAGLPPTPTPWAIAPAGWWRHGPSAPFAISELRAADVTYYRDFPVPASTIETTTAPDITTALPGFTGARLFVGAFALGDDVEGPTVAPTAWDAFSMVPTQTGLATVVRVPVPPGAESGRDGGFARIDLRRATLINGSPASRWGVRVVPINDWGEVGPAVVGTVERDGVGPTLNLVVPFTSAVWPLSARLPGTAEPGSRVVVEGIGPVALDRRGRFLLETTLAPWPQTLRVSATDASGNTTVAEYSVIGGVDYRRFPWSLLAAVALLSAVAARGLLGGRRGTTKREPLGRWSRGGFDDAGPAAEIEDLPPGSGLAPR